MNLDKGRLNTWLLQLASHSYAADLALRLSISRELYSKDEEAGQGQYLRISPYLKDPPSVNVDHLEVLRDAILGTMFEQNHCKYV